MADHKLSFEIVKNLHTIYCKEIEKTYVKLYNEGDWEERFMTKMRRRKNFRKHLSSFAILGVVLLLLVFVSVASLKLRVQNENKQARIQELESQIAEEEKKSEELEEYSKYVQTKKYAEEVAKEKLGLVYEDEIIFKAED